MKELLIKRWKIIAVSLLVMMFALELTSSLGETQTIDEGVHLAAGYSYHVTGDFRMNPEHPPFVKLIASFPHLLLPLDDPRDNTGWQTRDQWAFAREFLYENSVSADTLLLLGRIPIMVMSILLGILIFHWAKDLFGILGALFALALYALDPNIIAHSRYVTTDVPLALFLTLSVYLFVQYLRAPSFTKLFFVGITFAFAQLTKFSAVILIPTFLILYLLYGYWYRGLLSGKFFLKTFIVITLLTIGLTFIVYGFEVNYPLDDPRVQELYSRQEEILTQGKITEYPKTLQNVIRFTDRSTRTGRTLYSLMDNLPVPAYSYLRGIIQIASHNAGGHGSYLLGNYSNFGWWWYFPFAFLVKAPAATLIFIVLLVVLVSKYFFVKNFSERAKRLVVFIPLAVPFLLYLAMSMTSRINIGIRHILPLLPFLYIGLAVLPTMRFDFRRERAVHLVFLILLCTTAISVFLVYPHFLAYFNEFAGGPPQGPKYLLDSNIDWGQDVKHLKRYMTQNNIPYVCMSYFGQASLEYYGIDFRYLPDNEHFQDPASLNCVVAISVTSLFSQSDGYSWLRSYHPVKKVGYSIYVYDFRTK